MFLSGDVHYGFTMQMGYWVLDPGWQPRPATRVVQLTASSFRAQRNDLAPLVAIDLAQQIGVTTSAQTRLGWHRGSSGPRRRGPPLLAGADPFTPHLQLLLAEDPIVVSLRGHPARPPQFVRDPEWAWATAAVADQRADEDRFSQVDPPPPFSTGPRSTWSARSASGTSGRRSWPCRATGSGGRTSPRSASPSNVDDGKLATLQHRIYGFDPQDVNP